jgi:predicted amidohydrolase YtcJ
MSSLLIHRAEIDGVPGIDCRIRDGLIVEIGPELRRHGGERIVDADGGALLPGLADHHLHVLSLAAALESVDLSAARSPASAHAMLTAAAQTCRPDEWVRAIGYDEIAHGALDRDLLDALVPQVPVRVQHRGGALWIVNSAAAAAVHLDESARPALERATGRLWRADSWLRDALGREAPDLEPVGALLGSFGVTHVNDATEDEGNGVAAALAAGVTNGRLRQRIQVMGAGMPGGADRVLDLGPRKLVVSDHELPSLPELSDRVHAARAGGRAVAIHCVTREALVLTVAALESVGSIPGDRIEHCAVAPDESVRALHRLGARVVTQPSLIARRGDDYLERVDPADLDELWRYGGLLAAGVRVAPSSDAPYGDPDPWLTLRAASDRRSPSGRVLGLAERVSPAQALRGLLSPLNDPGGRPRRVAHGAPADIVVLDRPLVTALRDPTAEVVALTLIGGEVVYQR